MFENFAPEMFPTFNFKIFVCPVSENRKSCSVYLQFLSVCQVHFGLGIVIVIGMQRLFWARSIQLKFPEGSVQKLGPKLMINGSLFFVRKL